VSSLEIGIALLHDDIIARAQPSRSMSTNNIDNPAPTPRFAQDVHQDIGWLRRITWVKDNKSTTTTVAKRIYSQRRQPASMHYFFASERWSSRTKRKNKHQRQPTTHMRPNHWPGLCEKITTSLVIQTLSSTDTTKTRQTALRLVQTRGKYFKTINPRSGLHPGHHQLNRQDHTRCSPPHIRHTTTAISM
jgi:hypothetical protein